MALVSMPVLAQDFCAQLAPMSNSLASCQDQLNNTNREFRQLADVLRENERLISNPRVVADRQARLQSCQSNNTKLMTASQAQAQSVENARASVAELAGRKEELVRFVRENLQSTFECVAIDPKYGNTPDHTGQPRVYLAQGRTQDEARQNLRNVAAQRGNMAWDRLKEAYRCFEVLDRENAGRIDRDVKAMGATAQSIRFGG
jgi:chromosome segregation ATPase